MLKFRKCKEWNISGNRILFLEDGRMGGWEDEKIGGLEDGRNGKAKNCRAEGWK